MMVSLKKINSKNILVLCFLNVFLFPIYPINLRPTLIVLLLFSAINYAIAKKITFNVSFNQDNKSFYINTSLFFILCASLLYTKDIDSGISLIVRMSPLLILPIIFKLINDKKHISESTILKAYRLFYLSVVLLFFSFFVYFYFNGDVTVNFLRNYNERINNLLGKYTIHPIYASLYISIALILSTTLYKKQFLNRGIILFFNILLGLNLILLARKSAIITMFVFFVVYQLKFRKINNLWKTVSILIIFLLLIAVLVFVPDISYRFKELIDVFGNSKSNGSIGLRMNIINCNYNLISQNIIFGYGIGDFKDALFNCYQAVPDVFNGKYYNAHNQYLSVWLSSGVFGFASLVTILVYNCIKSIKSKNLISLAILILFSIIMLIESILERQDGVMIFALYVNLFAFLNSEKQTNTIR